MGVDKVLIALIIVVLIVTAVVAGLKMMGGEDEPPIVALPEAGDMSLVVIGIQGLEASMVERLTADGRLPNLARLMGGGATGSYATLGRSVDARIVWTSLVTGMLPENQGVGGMKLSRRGEMVDAPLVPRSRTVGALWTYLADAGESSCVIGWPGTWPVEEIDGKKIIHIKPPIIVKELAQLMELKPFKIIQVLGGFCLCWEALCNTQQWQNGVGETKNESEKRIERTVNGVIS